MEGASSVTSKAVPLPLLSQESLEVCSFMLTLAVLASVEKRGRLFVTENCYNVSDTSGHNVLHT